MVARIQGKYEYNKTASGLIFSLGDFTLELIILHWFYWIFVSIHCIFFVVLP
jgi:hypothetical protein